MKLSNYVVGIGASAGGLEAIQQLFDYIPDNTGMSFIIVQHLSPNFKSLMPELMAKHTKMEIFTSENEQEIKPNCIYLNKSNNDLVIKDHRLMLKDKDPSRHLNLPIDMFFHSLAVEFQEMAIAIILSGTGSDGSRGIRSIKETGGTTMIQDPESAQFNGMPNTAIATNLAEYILPPERIARELIKLSSKSIVIPELVSKSLNSNETIFQRILEEVFKSTGIDFRLYKQNTLIRRLEKRMTINNVESLERYLELLLTEPGEKEMLKKDFLISVTSFFRDIDAFQVLKEKVILNLLTNRQAGDMIRVWVAGCATGEEAYSFAILLDEFIEKTSLRLDFKIFATDIDIDALKVAGFGTYPVNIATDISNERLEKYFIKTGDKFQISKKIREKIVFSYHNLLKDPPFVRMDLITCRNLLIYLDNKAQKKILLNFQFAVKNQGFLFLGSSESLGDLQKYFEVIDTKWKVYKNISDQKVLPSYIMPEEKLQLFDYKAPVTSLHRIIPYDRENADHFYYRYIAENYAPSCLIVDGNYNLVFMLGNAKKYLHFRDGVFDTNLLNLAPKELLRVFRSGLKKVREQATPVQIQNVKLVLADEAFETTLSFRSVIRDTDKTTLYIIEFGDKNIIKNKKPKVYNFADYDDSSKERIDELESELKVNKNELQNVIEELETSNEELQSSNEELLASNEELQSTNEELQSVNEELYTVNTELQEKNKELLNLNSDMNNLLNSTEIGTLFLDRNLNIRKFTPALKKHFNLREEDIGRPINSFASNFNENITDEIVADAENVLRKYGVSEREIMDKDGHYYLIRINPFITHDKRPDGAVVTLTDITSLKLTEKELIYRRNLLSSIIKYLPGALVFLYDHNMNLLMADGEELYSMGMSPDTIIGKKLKDFSGAKELKTLEKHYIEAFSKGKKVSFETRLKNQDYFINAIPINGNENGNSSLLVLGVNATVIKKTEAELLKLNQAVYQAPSPIVITNMKGEITYANPKFEYVTGYNAPEVEGKPASILRSGKHNPAFYRELWETILGGQTWRGEFFNTKKDGTNYWELASISPLKNKMGRIIGFVKVSEDVTEIKRIQRELKEAKDKAEIANIYKNNFLANMSHEIRTPMNGIIGFSNLLKNTGLSSSEKEEYVRIIHNNSLQLLNLIDDIIDISKIEAGELKIVIGECHIIQLMYELKLMFEHEKDMLRKDEVEIILRIPDGYENLVVKTDSIRIKQILTNLISNALKFTHQGKIEFGFEIKNAEMIFFVKDTGIGIPEDKLEVIFNRFEQSEITISKKYGGTGLGLSISKGIVDLLGGKIWVNAVQHQGSSFFFTIPFEKVLLKRFGRGKAGQ